MTEFRAPNGEDDPIIPFIRINVWAVKSTIAAFLGCFFGQLIFFYSCKIYQLTQGDMEGFKQSGHEWDIYAIMGGGLLLVALSTIHDTFTWGWWR